MRFPHPLPEPLDGSNAWNKPLENPMTGKLISNIQLIYYINLIAFILIRLMGLTEVQQSAPKPHDLECMQMNCISNYSNWVRKFTHTFISFISKFFNLSFT